MRAKQSGVQGAKSEKAGLAVRLLAPVMLWALCGCSTVSEYLGIGPEKDPCDLTAAYDHTRVNKSLTLDVLPRIEAAPRELVSRSETVVASVGQGKDGYRTWFTMVAFHEYTLTAIRKYFFDVDERARARPYKSLRFDCEITLDKQVVEKSYTDQYAMRIAILRHVLETLREDIEELRRDVNAPSQNNETLNICGLLIKQVFDTVLLKMDISPVLASKLDEPAGVEFDHINFDKGRIGMVVENDIARVKIRLGALVRRFEEPPPTGDARTGDPKTPTGN